MTPYYEDGTVTLYYGDCLELGAWLKADVLVTDPPYGVGMTSGTQVLARRSGTVSRQVTGDQSTDARDAALRRWRLDNPERPAIMFGSWRVARPERVRHRLIWHKTGMTPGVSKGAFYPVDEEIYVCGPGWVGGPMPSVLVTNEFRSGANAPSVRFEHPTPKPVGLMEQLIAKCPPGVIADPFAGSGSTLLAARNLGRKAIGVEIEERYCETIARRLAQGVLL